MVRISCKILPRKCSTFLLATTCDGIKAHIVAEILNAPHRLLCSKLGHQSVMLLKASRTFKRRVLVRSVTVSMPVTEILGL